MQKLRIATWNVERVPAQKLDEIQTELQQINADILILTETHIDLRLKDYNCISTDNKQDGISYRPGECRSTILSKYPILSTIPTHDPITNLAVEIETPFGILAVLGCIIGILGNRHPTFEQDFNGLIKDVAKLAWGENLIVAGDFNQTFSDNYYFTTAGRYAINSLFGKYLISNLTAGIPENIDHIAMSRTFFPGKNVAISEFNTAKTLSDHKGIFVDINW